MVETGREIPLDLPDHPREPLLGEAAPSSSPAVDGDCPLTAHLAEEAHTPSQRVTVTLAVHPW